MNIFRRISPRALLVFWVLAGFLSLAGCATNNDPENRSERPWNTPKTWEHGLPSGIMEGR